MRLVSKKTTRSRVFLALVVAFVLPSLVLGQTYNWLDKSASTPTALADALISTAPILVIGAFFGWPYVLGSAVAWALLDQTNRHYPWTAAATGLMAGGAVAAFNFRDGKFSDAPIAYPLCIGLGLVTGLCVWIIAYGRQSRLPEPTAPVKPARPLLL